MQMNMAEDAEEKIAFLQDRAALLAFYDFPASHWQRAIDM